MGYVSQRGDVADLLLVAVFGPLALVVPSFLYQNSTIIGWSASKGFEGVYFALIATSFFATFIFFLIRRKYHSLPVISALVIIGSFIPALNSPPFWAWAPDVKDDFLQSSDFHLEGRVAHAGGAFGGLTLTNSIEALVQNAEHFDYFEIDLINTSDGEIVCVHDWPSFHQRATGERRYLAPTYEQFLELSNSLPYVPCNLVSLVAWAEDNPTKHIVLDSKTKNATDAYRAFVELSTDVIRERVFPQIYKPEEYQELSSDQWGGIIWTLYKRFPSQEVLEAVAFELPLAAITLPKERASDLSFENIEVPVYAHTVNKLSDFKDLRLGGVSEIYTDFIYDY